MHAARNVANNCADSVCGREQPLQLQLVNETQEPKKNRAQ